MQERALAAARRADDNFNISFMELEGNTFQNFVLSVTLSDIFGSKHRNLFSH
jgi:hypothetical protein